MAQLYLTERAIDDLKAIKSHSIDTFGKSVADRYLKQFETALDLIRASPNLLREKENIAGHLRFYRVEKHWLVCDIIDGHVYVLTVKHGSMDLPNRIAELEPQLIAEAKLMHRKIQDSKADNDAD